MATYKEIKGTTVKVRSSSMPTTYPQVAGELYYNSSNGQYEFLGPGTGAWSTGGSLNTARSDNGSAGTQTAALTAGGDTSPGYRDSVESYNGTSWKEVATLNPTRLGLGGSGASNTEAVAFGGSEPPSTGKTEVWNGTAWTEQGDLSNARSYLGSTKGSSTAALAMGGGSSTNVESFAGAGSNSTVDFTVS